MVENEYEDIGRKVLDGQDLQVDLDDVSKAKKHGTSATAAAATATEVINGQVKDVGSPRIEETADGVVEIRDIVVDTSSPRHTAELTDESEQEGKETMPTYETIPVVANENWRIGGDQKDWATDDTTVEELLGICYKSFTCGSVALFVPTPFGDFIAFHEGCPHYYLSMESIAAAKRDDKYATMSHCLYLFL